MKMKKERKSGGKRHEGMKTALGSGSQHREKDVNDSRGEGMNNAGLPLSLHPSVPLSLSPTLPSSSFSCFLHPLCPLLYIFLHSIYLQYSALSCLVCAVVKSPA